MLLFGWSQLVLWIPTLPHLFPSLRRPFQVYQLQLVSPSPSCSLTFLVLWLSQSVCLSFHFLWFSLRGPLGWQSPLSLFNFQLYFLFLTILHQAFTQDLPWGKVVILCIQQIYDFCCFFYVIFFSCIDCIIWRGLAVPQSAILLLLLLIRVFHISVSWWSFTGYWVTASLLKSPGLFSVFWQFSVMLLFGWSPLGRELLNLPGPLIIL